MELATGKSPEPAGWKACATYRAAGLANGFGRRLIVGRDCMIFADHEADWTPFPFPASLFL
ncbi:MAG TPA: hypothetical protein VF988_00905, partial [Verrucomicrobiae bacterium]